MKLNFSHEGKNLGRGFWKVGYWGRNLGLQREELLRNWRKLHNEELHDLYYSPNIVMVIKTRMRWVGHVACRYE
jgi:hypothetical protein